MQCDEVFVLHYKNLKTLVYYMPYSFRSLLIELFLFGMEIKK